MLRAPYDIPRSFNNERLLWIANKLMFDYSAGLEEPCLIYDGELDKDLYPRIGVWDVNGKRIQMQGNRYVLQMALNIILPDNFVACHRCDNPSCLQPAHLWPGTVRENNEDKYRKEKGLPRNDIYKILNNSNSIWDKYKRNFDYCLAI